MKKQTPKNFVASEDKSIKKSRRICMEQQHAKQIELRTHAAKRSAATVRYAANDLYSIVISEKCW